MARFRDRAATQRMKLDTSPPIWELRGTRTRSGVYARQHLLSQQIRFALTPNVCRRFHLETARAPGSAEA